MASSLRTKLRIAYNVLFAPGFWDALAGRFALVFDLTPPAPLSHGERGETRVSSGSGLPSGITDDAVLPPLPMGEGGRGGEVKKDLRGALHNHTTYSDGLSDVPTVMAAGKEAGVDFVLLADHNTMQPLRDGWQEKYAEDSTFLLIGTEVTVAGGRFLLALDVPKGYEPIRDVSAQEGIDAIRASNGFPLISLPFDMKHPFEDWTVVGYEGLEVLNFSTIARRHINFLSLFWLLPIGYFGGVLAAIRAMLSRPDAALARWDSLTKGGERQVVGIGSLDAHAQMKIGKKKYPIPSYADSFRACQTHVLVPEEVTGVARLDAVNAAMRQGHCYFSYDCLGDPTGFTFTATNEKAGTITVMGDRATCSPNEEIRFTATAPGKKVLLRLYRDGEAIASSATGTLEVVVTAVAGAYRVEAYQYRAHLGPVFWGVRPWIWSNPIYLKK